MIKLPLTPTRLSLSLSLSLADAEDLIPTDDDPPPLVEEIDGPKGPEPTRFGDWERKGRCVDF